MRGVEYLNRPCGLALAGIAPLSALFVTPPNSSTPSVVYGFLQRMWLAWQFAQGFADLEPLPARARIRANTHWCQRFTAIANDLFDLSLPANCAHSNLVVGLVCRFLDAGGSDFPLLLANFASHSAPLLERYNDGFFTFLPSLTPCAQCSQAALSPHARICLRVSNKGKCLSCLLGNIPGDCFANLDSTLEVDQGDDDDDDDPPSRKRKNSTTSAPQDSNKTRKTDEKASSSSRPRRSGPFGPASVQAQSQNDAARTAGAKKAGSAAGTKPAKKTRPGDAEMDVGVEDQSFKPPPRRQAGRARRWERLPRASYRRFAPIDPVDLTLKWNDAGMTVVNSIIDLKRDFVRVFGAPGQSRTSLGLLVPGFVAFQAWLEERDVERGHIEEVDEMAGDGGVGPSRDPSIEVVSPKKGKAGGRNKP
ncbi:hypothetical protein AURDEDRAFT_175080 [Auricularia subglabra TFB-10046 SS5]|nr:hypothetical protein AURDEDRAFT_175080 [Auricularia subglabra TFB-10046 SS5]